MTSPDIGPIDLQRIIKTLTREELEAYALLNVLTVDQFMKQFGDNCSGILLIRVEHKGNEPNTELDEALELGQAITLEIQTKLMKDSHRKN